MTCCSDSGSRRSPSAVEPVTSAKTTVTVLRVAIDRVYDPTAGSRPRGRGGAGSDPAPPRPFQSGRGDRAEEAVVLVVRAGGEEQRVHRTVRRRAVAELQRPQPVDRQRLPVGRAQLAAVLELPVRQLLVRVDLAVAEVPDEQ